MFKALNAFYVMVDSGGYQALVNELMGGIINCDKTRPIICNKNEINITPEHMIAASMRLKPMIMTSLDVPVPKVSDPYLQYQHFIKKLGANLVWMKETALLRQKYCPDIELFIPIQCYDLQQFTNYIEKPLMELSFNGVSLPQEILVQAELRFFF